jgi:UDP-N-acetylglucosamine diphosphorylase/glucosamine-1-phosphate N-acetyltransferase
MNICIFEDGKFRDFYPLTLSRPVFELRSGASTLREKICRYFPKERISLAMREYLINVFSATIKNVSFSIPSAPVLFINGRILPDESLMKRIQVLKEGEILLSDSTLIAAHVRNGEDFYKKVWEGDLTEFREKETDARTVSFPWDLLTNTATEIEREFPHFGKKWTKKHKSTLTLLGEDGIHIGENVDIMDGSVLDARNGPVIIETGTVIEPHCYLKGPLFIGERSLIKGGARIYGPTSLGNVTKVGGEIGECIFQGYSNKQHDGFLGHSYIGEWVNIGAGTCNSDLKNNYKEITVYINNKPVDTGLRFFGSIMGDHSKTAINTSLNTGTVMGFSVNIFGEGFPPKFIPSFSWGGKRKFITYKLNDSIDTAEKVMKRRGVSISEPYKKMMKVIFETTKEMRHYGV